MVDLAAKTGISSTSSSSRSVWRRWLSVTFACSPAAPIRQIASSTSSKVRQRSEGWATRGDCRNRLVTDCQSAVGLQRRPARQLPGIGDAPTLRDRLGGRSSCRIVVSPATMAGSRIDRARNDRMRQGRDRNLQADRRRWKASYGGRTVCIGRICWPSRRIVKCGSKP